MKTNEHVAKKSHKFQPWKLQSQSLDRNDDDKSDSVKAAMIKRVKAYFHQKENKKT
jgi:hypothetical protein